MAELLHWPDLHLFTSATVEGCGAAACLSRHTTRSLLDAKQRHTDADLQMRRWLVGICFQSQCFLIKFSMLLCGWGAVNRAWGSSRRASGGGFTAALPCCHVCCASRVCFCISCICSCFDERISPESPWERLLTILENFLFSVSLYTRRVCDQEWGHFEALCVF